MAKEFKRRDSKDFKDKKSTDHKKSRTEKKEKPSFERFRDDSRPSDFGSPKRRSSFGDFRKKRDDNKSYKKWDDKEEKPSYEDRSEEKKPFKKKSFSDKPLFKKKWDDKEANDERPKAFKKSFDKPGFKKRYDDKPTFKSKSLNPYDLDERDLEYGKPKPAFEKKGGSYTRKPYGKKGPSKKSSTPQREEDGTIRLNKYLSNAGICSRREADDLIASGVVQVNGKTITEMGFRVKPTDIIKYGGQTLKKERMVYLILNKPKDYITTVDDPQKRKTVLELVQGACKERIYPVGRLDRSTTGLLMFTNDGDLTKKLTHPRYGVRKIYHVELDKPLKHQDLNKISEGIELEDGEIKVDEVTYVGDGSDKTQIGIEIHSGKNRIVRRIFEHLGYNVRKLDRVMFGSLTKKDLPRGRWRLLTEAEVGILKMISAE